MRGFGEVACSAIDERPSPGCASRPRSSRSGDSIIVAAAPEGARPPAAGLLLRDWTAPRASVVHILSTGHPLTGAESPHRRTRVHEGRVKSDFPTSSHRRLD